MPSTDMRTFANAALCMESLSHNSGSPSTVSMPEMTCNCGTTPIQLTPKIPFVYEIVLYMIIERKVEKAILIEKRILISKQILKLFFCMEYNEN